MVWPRWRAMRELEVLFVLFYLEAEPQAVRRGLERMRRSLQTSKVSEIARFSVVDDEVAVASGKSKGVLLTKYNLSGYHQTRKDHPPKGENRSNPKFPASREFCRESPPPFKSTNVISKSTNVIYARQ
jgi:hypothetical protein